MAQERPLIRQLARTIVDVARDTSGLVVLFDDDSIERLDDDGTSIARVATLASTGGGVSELLPLADGRLVVRPSVGVLQVLRTEPGGAATLERMTQLGELESFGGVVAHEDGFFAWSKRGLLFERGGQSYAVSTEHWIERAIVTPHGALTWGFQGWFLVTRGGDVVLKGDERFLGATARIGDLLLATSFDGWVALDLTKNTRVEPPTLRGEITRVCAVGDRFVCARESELVAFDPSFAVLERQRLPWAPKVLAGRGDFVVAAIDGDARVGPLGALDEVQLVGRLDAALAFGDSIALHDQSPELTIWSRRGISTLTHDARPWRVRSLGDALATTEADVLRVHRPGVDHGAPRVSGAAGPPMGQAIVVNGMLGRRVDEGLVAYSLELPGGTRARVPRDAPYRAAIDATSAHHVVELLARRDFERAPLDEALSKLDPWSHASWDAVVNRHPKDSVGLFLRGLFEGDEPASAATSGPRSASASISAFDSSVDASLETSDADTVATDATTGDAGTDDDPRLDPRFAIQVLATRTYDRVVAELAWALGRSPLELIAAIRAGRVTFDDALEIPGFTYLGTFECSGKLVVCDPCHRDKPVLRADLANVAKGTWHVLVREGVGDAAGRIAELVASHADGLACSADQEVRALIGVDAGIVGIYDHDCPRPDLDAHFETGPFAGLGAHSRSGWGDGGYVAYVARVDRRVVKVRVPFFDDGAVDRSVLLPTASARTYSPRERFGKDDLVAHPKFGVGRVIEAGPDRVEIEFRGERRTLVHGRG
ncbi:MAG: hypothetical protein MUE69_05095 [Myxococcota bacterium]|jgi:hypothetical protein|nr:hypothetical protein [Myxococcota bacterium]